MRPEHSETKAKTESARPRRRPKICYETESARPNATRPRPRPVQSSQLHVKVTQIGMFLWYKYTSCAIWEVRKSFRHGSSTGQVMSLLSGRILWVLSPDSKAVSEKLRVLFQEVSSRQQVPKEGNHARQSRFYRLAMLVPTWGSVSVQFSIKRV